MYIRFQSIILFKSLASFQSPELSLQRPPAGSVSFMMWTKNNNFNLSMSFPAPSDVHMRLGQWHVFISNIRIEIVWNTRISPSNPPSGRCTVQSRNKPDGNDGPEYAEGYSFNSVASSVFGLGSHPCFSFCLISPLIV